ncbi:MAG: ComEA family DNA-binding protein [Arcanobacterium sp.]|nr:ComEA family DNA-binding protein [Arcanobacterium sp.]
MHTPPPRLMVRSASAIQAGSVPTHRPAQRQIPRDAEVYQPEEGRPSAPPRAHDFARIALGAGLGADVLALPESEDSQATWKKRRRRTRWSFSVRGTQAFAVLIGIVLGVATVAVMFVQQPRPVAIQASGSTPQTSHNEVRESGEGTGNSADKPKTEQIVVYVSGAVKNPGVVTIAAHSRVVDAVQAAGGFAADAQVAAINLAALAHDGQHIHVLKNSEDATKLPPDSAGEGTHSAGTGGTTDSSGAQANQLEAGTEKIDLNTANRSELEKVPGIGAVMAGRIIAWREQHGGLKSVKDLLNVEGIGQKTLAKIEPFVAVY